MFSGPWGFAHTAHVNVRHIWADHLGPQCDTAVVRLPVCDLPRPPRCGKTGRLLPSLLCRYIYSLYWAVTTLSTVDLGGNVPSTMPQVGLLGMDLCHATSGTVQALHPRRAKRPLAAVTEPGSVEGYLLGCAAFGLFSA